MLTSVPQLIIQSWKLYRQHFSALRGYMFWIFLPTFVLSLSGIAGLFTSAFLPVSEMIIALCIGLLSIAGSIFSILISLSLTRALKQAVETGTIPSVQSAVKATSPYLLSVIWASILLGVMFFAGIILLVIPAIIFSVWYIFTAYTVIFEEKRGWAALKASKDLVKGRWFSITWRIVAPAIVFSIAISLVSNLISWPLVALEPISNGNYISLAITSLEALSSLIYALVAAILAPLASLPPLLVYLEAKKTPVATMTPPAPVTPA